jgi:DNA polymerase V
MSAVNPFLKTPNLDIYWVVNSSEVQIPFYRAGIAAGFPSPATDFLESTIDLNKHFIKNPSSTFLAIAKGFSMRDAGIDNGDILIIDRSLEPGNGKIAVCVINGEFTLKRLSVSGNEIWLTSENKEFKPIKISEFHDFEIWGILTFSIKAHK